MIGLLAEIGIVGQLLWWAAIAVVFLVVIPVVALIATRIVRAAREIRDSAGDILVHADNVASGLDPLPELARTTELAARTREAVVRYVRATERLV